VLAATNKDLEEEIEAGRFRADLFYRLNVVPIRVPSLRERLADLPLLVADFAADLARKGLGTRSFSPEALQAMARHGWPGNVRELRNFVERMIIMCPESEISAEAVLQVLQPLGGSPPAGEHAGAGFYAGLSFREAKKAFERDFLQTRLRENDGKISTTAEQIGLERSHLHKKMKSLTGEEE
jgi:two-component system nitrogen regulation response regulator NtrX